MPIYNHVTYVYIMFQYRYMHHVMSIFGDNKQSNRTQLVRETDDKQPSTCIVCSCYATVSVSRKHTLF